MVLAEDGEKGLERAISLVPDLVVCDVMLPRINGYQVVQSLKLDQNTSHIPILMLTARSDDDSRLEGLRERVDDFMTKPFSDEELVIRINNLLTVRDILKARYTGELYAGDDPGHLLTAPERSCISALESAMEEHYSNPEFGLSELA